MQTELREQWVQGKLSDSEYMQRVFEQAIEICDRCGEEVSNIDSVSYCEEDGVVEGNTHWEAR